MEGEEEDFVSMDLHSNEDVEKDCEGYDSPDWNVVGVKAGHDVGV